MKSEKEAQRNNKVRQKLFAFQSRISNDRQNWVGTVKVRLREGVVSKGPNYPDSDTMKGRKTSVHGKLVSRNEVTVPATSGKC